ncbi:MAG: hypothetical protein MRJ65_16470 [Candidatus Brocadiaceae bacterium]|nr:hypothetical protein [Candidatus Brocadiaceae bacterium]
MDYDRNYLEITPISGIETTGSFSFRKRAPVSVSLFAKWAESRSGHVDDEDYSDETNKKVWTRLTFFPTTVAVRRNFFHCLLKTIQRRGLIGVSWRMIPLFAGSTRTNSTMLLRTIR